MADLALSAGAFHRWSPGLCKVLKAPLTELGSKLDAATTELKRGDTSSLVGINAALATITGLCAQHSASSPAGPRLPDRLIQLPPDLGRNRIRLIVST